MDSFCGIAKPLPQAPVGCVQVLRRRTEFPLRVTNTLDAMEELYNAEILSEENHNNLKDSYIFQRGLIDALRMVRGHAKDLAVPPPGSEEFQFLARRLGYGNDSRQLEEDLERFTGTVRELTCLLEQVP